MKISVILSVSNGGELLERSIKSVLAQTLSDFEFIIIDDGSTDGSRELIENYRKNDNRIILILNETKQGLTRSLISGVSLAKGEYIARQDAHSFSLPERFEKQYHFLETNPDVTLLGTGHIKITQTGVTTTSKIFKKNSSLNTMLEKTNVIPHYSIMFRNTEYIRYREKFYYAQDYDLYLSIISSSGTIDILEDTLVGYNVSMNSVSSSLRFKQYLFAQKARDFYTQRKLKGPDSYDAFSPREILNMKISEVTDPGALAEEIDANFKINNFSETRQLFYRYFRLKRVLDKYVLYFLASLLPVGLINLFRNALWGKSALKYRKDISEI